MIELPEGYKERLEVPELDLISRVHGRFKGTGHAMPASQRKIYENIRAMFLEDVKKRDGFPKRIHRPTVVDVGCGIGIGSNILSQEAQFVWGIDSNEESIRFATQLFERIPNNIYYTPQLTFDVVDAMEEPRDVMEFDYIVCVEVIEHIPRDKAVGLLNFLNRFVRKEKNKLYAEGNNRTIIYLTTPNRNSPRLQQDTPFNEHHCYEASAAEMYAFLTQHYKYVTVMDENMVPQELNTEASPLVYKLEVPV